MSVSMTYMQGMDPPVTDLVETQQESCFKHHFWELTVKEPHPTSESARSSSSHNKVIYQAAIESCVTKNKRKLLDYQIYFSSWSCLPERISKLVDVTVQYDAFHYSIIQKIYPHYRINQKIYPHYQISQKIYHHYRISQHIYIHYRISQKIYTRYCMSKEIYHGYRISQEIYPRYRISQKIYPCCRISISEFVT